MGIRGLRVRQGRRFGDGDSGRKYSCRSVSLQRPAPSNAKVEKATAVSAETTTIQTQHAQNTQRNEVTPRKQVFVCLSAFMSQSSIF